MEYLHGGDLRHYLDADDRMLEDMVREVTYQVLEGIDYLHSLHITHRDIKPDNILVASSHPLHVKLSDFGLSIVSEASCLTTFCGTLLYLAPEVFPDYGRYEAREKRSRASEGIKYSPSYGQSVDIWSIGILAYTLLAGSGPYNGNNAQEVLFAIMTTQLNTDPLVRVEASPEAIEFIIRALNRRPEQRPNEQNCLKDPWLHGIRSSSAAMLEVDRASQALIADLQGDLGASQLSLYDTAGSDKEEGDVDEDDQSQSQPSKRPRQHGRFHSVHGAYESMDPSQSTSASMQELLQRSPTVLDPLDHRPMEGRLFGEISPSLLQGTSHACDTPPSSSEQQLELLTPTGSDEHGLSGTDSSTQDDRPAHPRSSIARTTSLPMRRTSYYSSIRPVLHAQNGNQATRRRPTRSADRYSSKSNPSGHYGRTSHSSGHCDRGSPSKPEASSVTPMKPIERSILKFDRRIRIEMLFEATGASTAHDKPRTSRAPELGVAAPNEAGLGLHQVEGKDGRIRAVSRTRPNTRKTTSAKDISVVPREDTASQMCDPRVVNAPKFLGDFDIKEPPDLWGKLVALPGSAYPNLSIPMREVLIKLGRGSANNVLFDSRDERIARGVAAIQLYEPYVNLQAFKKAGKDWRGIPAMVPVVTVPGGRGVFINGVKFAMAEGAWGRLYHGDELVIWKEGKNFIGFRCEFYFGQGQLSRPLEKKGFQTYDVPHRRSHQKNPRSSEEETFDA